MTLEQADTRKSGVLSEHSSQSPANALVQTPIAMAAAAILTGERIDDLSHLRSLAVRHDRTALDSNESTLRGVLMSPKIAIAGLAERTQRVRRADLRQPFEERPGAA